MASEIFDALAVGMDSQTAIAVQSLINSQAVPESAPDEDDDIFQCGKCKKQFNSIQSFVSHKSRCTGPQVVNATPTHQLTAPTPIRALPNSGMATASGNITHSAFTPTVQQIISKQQVANYGSVPASPLTSMGQGMVLAEDLITLQAMETNTSIQVASTTTSPMLPQVSLLPPTREVTSQNLTAEAVLGSPRNTVGLSVGTEVVLSGPAVSGSSSPPTVTVVDSGQAQQTHPSSVAVTSHVSSSIVQTSPMPPQAVLTAAAHAAGIPPGITMTEKPLQNKSPIKSAFLSARKANVINMADIDVGGGTLKQRRTKLASTMTGSSILHGLDDGKKRLQCQYCDKTFSKNFDLNQHIRSHTGEKPFQCIVCGRAFAQKSNVKKHMQTHKVWPTGTSQTLPKEPLQECIIADEVAMKWPQLNLSDKDLQNKRMLVIDSSYLCQYCPEKFKTYFQLKSHMTQHKSEQVYKCVLKDCSATFKELDTFLEHTKTHEENMKYRCHVCNRSFSSLYELGVHQYTHSLYPNQGPKPGPKHFRCTKCNNKYASPEALEHHRQTTSHDYRCPQCEKVFTCERYLRRHLAIHGSFGEFECEVCHKCFKTDHYLKMHLLIHSGVKPFSCEVCSMAFNRKDKLKRHMLKHDPVKRFKCPFRNHIGCMKEFNRQDKLKAHIISHSGLKPYKCTLCEKEFTRLPQLREHERIHRNDYKFNCDRCKRGFMREGLYRRHNCKPSVLIPVQAALDVLTHQPPAESKPLVAGDPNLVGKGEKSDSAANDDASSKDKSEKAESKEDTSNLRRSKRKVVPPKRHIVTITEEIEKERTAKRIMSRKMRAGLNRGMDPRRKNMNKINTSHELTSQQNITRPEYFTIEPTIRCDKDGNERIEYVANRINPEGTQIVPSEIHLQVTNSGELLAESPTADNFQTQVITLAPDQLETLKCSGEINLAEVYGQTQLSNLTNQPDLQGLGGATIITTDNGTLLMSSQELNNLQGTSILNAPTSMACSQQDYVSQELQLEDLQAVDNSETSLSASGIQQGFDPNATDMMNDQTSDVIQTTQELSHVNESSEAVRVEKNPEGSSN